MECEPHRQLKPLTSNEHCFVFCSFFKRRAQRHLKKQNTEIYKMSLFLLYCLICFERPILLTS